MKVVWWHMFNLFALLFENLLSIDDVLLIRSLL